MSKYKTLLDKIRYLKSKYKEDKDLVSVFSEIEEILETKMAVKTYSRRILSLVFIGWLIGSALFLFWDYTCFPTYILFTYLYANATILQETLKAVYLNPRFVLASIVSWLLAWRYSIIYYHVKYKVGGEVVGDQHSQSMVMGKGILDTFYQDL